jgi:hypothetical protein
LNNRAGAVQFVLNGNGSVITTGQKYGIQIPYSGTILGWTIVGETASGSVVLDLFKGTYAAFPTLTSITASAKPTVSAARKATSTTLTGWTTSVVKGDYLYVTVDSVSTFVWLNLSLDILKT